MSIPLTATTTGIRQSLATRLQRLLALPLASRGAAALHTELSRL